MNFDISIDRFERAFLLIPNVKGGKRLNGNSIDQIVGRETWNDRTMMIE